MLVVADDEWRLPTKQAGIAADWALWSKMPTAEVLSAVVLSLGIEPLKLSTRRRFDEVERRCNALVPGFRSRYALACANVSKTGPLHPVGSALLVNGRGGATVSLPEFGAWAIGIGWELPVRFPQHMQATEPIVYEHSPDVDAGRTAASKWLLGDAHLRTEANETPAAPQPDHSKLASRAALIRAFGSFTGMDLKWFDNVKDSPRLLGARMSEGQGGRSHIREPLFCPFLVMQWQIDPKKRKGRPMSSPTGWRMLKTHFPAVYAAYAHEDPNAD